MDYQIKKFSELTEELKEIWFHIEKESNHTCFNSLVWIENYIFSYKDYVKNSQLKIFVVFFQNKPICIFPFEIIKRFKINILQWACDIKSDFNAPLIIKNFNFDEKTFKNIWSEILKKVPEADIVYLKKQINYLDLPNPFVSFLKNSKEGNIQQINLPKKWDTYTDKYIKKKFYLDFLRTKRLIKKKGKIEFLIAKNTKEKYVFLETLIKQKKEKLIKNKSNSISEKDLNFDKNFEIFKKKQYDTQVSAIKLNGEFVALHWGIVFEKYFYYLLPSMKNNDIKKLSPGKLLLSLLVRWSISKKISTFDFGLGEENYKKNWSNKTMTISNHLKLRKLRGIFIFIILKIREKIKLKKFRHK